MAKTKGWERVRDALAPRASERSHSSRDPGAQGSAVCTAASAPAFGAEPGAGAEPSHG